MGENDGQALGLPPATEGEELVNLTGFLQLAPLPLDGVLVHPDEPADLPVRPVRSDS
jgi:hypothetical protein